MCLFFWSVLSYERKTRSITQCTMNRKETTDKQITQDGMEIQREIQNRLEFDFAIADLIGDFRS